MKPVSKKVCSVALSLALVLSMTTPAMAGVDYEKDEVVYINLGYDGSVSDIFVVNSYDMNKPTKVVDYGDYTSVRNLTTTEKIKFENGESSFTAPKGKFYYQGNLPVKEIPWNINISYKLDGKEISGDKLAGKSGHLEIVMSIKPNRKVNPVYIDNFAIQATATFDSDKCKNIDAPSATIASVGNDKQLSYIVLPDKEKEFKITTDITDFEMDGIAINGIPLSLDIDDPDTDELMDDVYDLQDGAVELDDGANKLDEGATTLNDGVSELKDGSEDLKDGTKDLKDATKKLRDGSQTLEEGFATLGDSSSQLKSAIASTQSKLVENTNQLIAVINMQTGAEIAKLDVESGDSTQQLIANGKMIEAKLQEIASTLGIPLKSVTSVLSAAVIDGEEVASEPETEKSEEKPEEKSEDNSTQEPIESEDKQESSSADDKIDNGSLNEAEDAKDKEKEPTETTPDEKDSSSKEDSKDKSVEDKIEQDKPAEEQDKDPEEKAPETQTPPAMNELMSSFKQIYEMQQFSFGMLQYMAGVEQISGGYDDMFDGIGKIDKGAKKLDDAVDELENGVDKLFDGALTLKDGTIELTDGTFELRDETSDMDTRVDDKIDDMLDEYRNKEFDPVSFVSTKNENIDTVQFAMKTKEIKIDEEEKPAEQVEEEPGFFQKLFSLFKFKKED